MIIKGRSRQDGGALARYLLKESERQQAKIIDLRDSATPELAEALSDWERTAIALTKGEKTLYHMQIRLADGEHLTREQWLHTVGKVEARLKLDQCPRAIVGHQLDGQLHLHIVYSRLDLEREKLVHLSQDRKAHHEVARQAEIAFNLRRLNREQTREKEQAREKDQPGSQRQRDQEHHQAKRGDTSREQVQKLVSAAFTAADSPAAFDANLKRLGITLQQGDKRDYVIEHRGQVYNPVRFIPGMTAAKMREKMKDYTPPPKDPEAEKQRREEAEKRRAEYQEKARRARARKPPQPKLKPRLYYGDPGI